jgi:hypothetical protein
VIAILAVTPFLAIAGGRMTLSFAESSHTSSVTDDVEKPEVMTVHEWGTFTSIAGADGKAIDWLPAGGPTDLPCFVERLDPDSLAKLILVSASGGVNGNRLTWGKVRMETPVLYFYSPHKKTVNVKVSFPQGLMTEWYPAAKVAPKTLIDAQKMAAGTGTIEWNDVQVTPAAQEDFPTENASSHYYAARKTGAAPLEAGGQREKFLFYRGIAGFDPPVSVQSSADGRITIGNLGNESIPGVVLFDNHAGKIRYRVYRDLQNSIVLGLPELTGSVEDLGQELEGLLQSQGMYPREAKAMVETWKDTWFERGTRVFYIVPPRTLNRLLPLEVSPSPVNVSRAFVGRMEVITPATQAQIRNAILSRDQYTMRIYGRFLEPIIDSLFLSKRISEEERSQAFSMMSEIGQGYVKQLAACARKGILQ